MVAASKSANALLSVRSRDGTILPPGIMGFENLIKPDEYTDAKGVTSKNFKVQVHHNPQQVELLAAKLQREVDSLWPKWLADAAGVPEPKAGWVKPDAAEWLDGQLKEPSERSRTQLPSIGFKNGAEYRDKKTGEMVMKVMRAYDGANTALDLPKLRLGMGSTVQPIVQVGIFKNSIMKQPDISLKLQGIRVLKLVQFGGGAQALAEVSDEDLAGLGEGFEADALGSYAKGATSTEAPQESFVADLDDELPF